MSNNQFNVLHSRATEIGETNDCGVKAVAVSLDLTYDQAHNLLRIHGRTFGKGTPTQACTIPALASMGFQLEAVRIPRVLKTLNQISYLGRRDRFMILVSGGRHILAVKDGKVADWTAGRSHRVSKVYKVVPLNNSDPVQIPGVAGFDKKDLDVPVVIGKSPAKRRSRVLYKMINKDTGEVYKEYKRKPKRMDDAYWAQGWIGGRKAETMGKLRIVRA